MRRRILTGEPTGILAYDGDEPAGWCSVAPADTFRRDDLGRIGDFVERAAAGRFRGFRPPGVELHRP